MNQPQEFAAFGSYPYLTNTTRSASSSRPYNTATGGFGNNRMAQHNQADTLEGAAPYDDRFTSQGGSFRQNARIQQAFADGYMGDNGQAWNYNSGAATVNGAMGDMGRIRAGNRGRAPIPTTWTVPDQPGSGNQLVPPYSASANFNPQLMMPAGAGPLDDRLGYQQSNYDGGMHSSRAPINPSNIPPDLIATAIVIKNIPFHVKKEQLAQLMAEMHLPQPYAFNYHFDNGIFRGLAFANFSSAEDTAEVIQRLNGCEVQGRKLRVEYKKQLPDHERERIEREKRERRGQLEEQHRPLTLNHQTSMHSLTAGPTGSGSRNSPLRKYHRRETPEGNADPLSSTGDLDLNNPETLHYYTELTIFKSDTSREIMVFETTITPQQRRTIHVLAHNMGLEHMSVGNGPNRQLSVMKPSANRASPTMTSTGQQQQHLTPLLDAANRSLTRAATVDWTPYSGGTIGRSNPTLGLPDGSPEANHRNIVRGAKSFADLRGDVRTSTPDIQREHTPSPAPSLPGFNGRGMARYGDYTPTTPGGTTSSNFLLPGTVDDMGRLSLNDSQEAISRPRQNPGAIGSQRPGLNGATSSRNAVVRPPHDPPTESHGAWGESAGFNGRGRTNGHVQRGSDSSESGVRSATRY